MYIQNTRARNQAAGTTFSSASYDAAQQTNMVDHGIATVGATEIGKNFFCNKPDVHHITMSRPFEPLAPAGPPAFALTPDLVEGAEAFAAAVEQLDFTDPAIAASFSGIASACQYALTQSGAPASGVNRGTDGVAGVKIQQTHTRHLDDHPLFKSMPSEQRQVLSLVGSPVLDGATAETLIALFMKLQIMDPNNSPETQAKLREVTSSLRQGNLKIEKQKNCEAQAKIKKAIKKAKKKKMFAMFCSVAAIVSSVVLAGVTFGLTAALVVGAFALAGALVAMGIAVARADGDFSVLGQGKIWETNVLQGLSLGASVGSLVVGIGSIASAIGQGAANAAKEAAKQVVQVSLRTAAEEGVKVAGQEVAKQAAEQAVSSISREICQKIVQAVACLLGLGMKATQAVLESQATTALLDAQKVQVDAKAYAKMAELYQEILESAGKSIEFIVRARNKVFADVMKMRDQKMTMVMHMQAAFAGV